MNFRQLQAFRAAMTTGSLTRAAELLGISQPAVSHLVANLERTLGLGLFERRNGRVFPTIDAEYLYDRANKTFSALDQLAAVADDIRDLKAGQLRIACLPGAAFEFLPRIVAEFIKDRTEVTVSLQPRSSQKVKEWIAAQLFDIAMAEIPAEDPAIEVEKLSIDCVCVMPEGHPLAARRVITPADLDGVPMVSLNRDHMTSFRIEDAFQAAGVRRQVRIETRLFLPLCVLVREGAGVGICDPLTVHDFRGKGVVVRPFEPAIPFSIGILYPAQRPRSRLTDEFSKLLRKRITELM